MNTKNLTFAIMASLGVVSTAGAQDFNENLAAGDTCVGSTACTDTWNFASNVGNADLWLFSSDPQILLEDSGVTNYAIENDAGIFGIFNETTTTRQFSIESGAPADSVFVGGSGTGSIGLFTNTPDSFIELTIGAASGSVSEMRLESTSVNYDVENGSGTFRIQDVTNSTFPLKIFSNAPTDSVTIESTTGDVGLGTTGPTASLHVRRTNGNSNVLVEEASASTAVRTMLELRNNGIPQLIFRDTSGSGVRWATNPLTNVGSYTINRIGSGQLEMEIQGDGDLVIAGTLTQGSSRMIKENFSAVDADEILTKLATLPITLWNYKGSQPSDRHLGPMAEDFAELFELGADNKHIAPSDLSAVAIAGVQALQTKHQERENVISDLKQRNIELQERVTALEKLINQVARQQHADNSLLARVGQVK